jgi:hypothetical protein
MKSPLSPSRTFTARHIAATLLTTALLFAAANGCATLGIPDLPTNRLLSCHSDDDCKKKDPKKPACANLRCVECAYDEECGESGLCTDNQCKKFFKATSDGDPQEAPKNLDACMSRCNDDQACVTKCNDQFRPVEAPKDEAPQ